MTQIALTNCLVRRIVLTEPTVPSVGAQRRRQRCSVYVNTRTHDSHGTTAGWIIAWVQVTASEQWSWIAKFGAAASADGPSVAWCWCASLPALDPLAPIWTQEQAT